MLVFTLKLVGQKVAKSGFKSSTKSEKEQSFVECLFRSLKPSIGN